MQFDIRTMTIEALRLHGDLLADLRVDDLAAEDADVARRIGWKLVERGQSFAFYAGRNLLAAAYGGYLLPPPNSLYWIGPSARERYHAPFLEKWSVSLMPGPVDGPRWEIGGGDLVQKDGSRSRPWMGLLHVDTYGEWARTTTGWIKLGRRYWS